MRVLIFTLFFLCVNSLLATTPFDTTYTHTDSVIKPTEDTINKNLINQNQQETLNIFAKRLQLLNEQTPMALDYNLEVQRYIDNYTGRNKTLISRMLSIKHQYFPLFERELDKFKLPLELKYLAIVESALQPKAKSQSGATGLWQFMYLTGKQYGLNVTSYVDDRQDPYKSTIAACNYFLDLYEMFGDWNLVLAAYNGGPGYLQRKINEVGSYNFWDLHPHLKEETRNYVPKFIATNYTMNFYQEHGITADSVRQTFYEIDTITILEQTNVSTLSAMLCLDEVLIRDLNPSFKDDVMPKNANLFLPKSAVTDFLLNETSSYIFINSVEKKEVLINEERLIYRVKKGDYLGKIANEFDVSVFQLKTWNNLNTSLLNIGDKLIIYVKTLEKIQ